MISFILLLNKRGQTRFSRYFVDNPVALLDRPAVEADLAKRCSSRGNQQCLMFEYKSFRIAFRRYASLYFVIAFDGTENQFAMLELIQACVEALSGYFENVSELDIMFNVDKVHMIIEEIILNGRVVETNQDRILAPLIGMSKRLVR